MAILPIRQWPDPVLRQRCAPVGVVTAPVRQLAADMLETMYDAPGRGLAAPQVGVALRLFVMDATWKQGTYAPLVVVDPQFLWLSDLRVTGTEGCLSIPGVEARVSRAAEARLRWHDLDGGLHEETLTGFAAVCAQHEHDHLEGIVTLDHLPPDARPRVLA